MSPNFKALKFEIIKLTSESKSFTPTTLWTNDFLNISVSEYQHSLSSLEFPKKSGHSMG